MRVITLQNEKGGTGKSTLSALIATGLALIGYRVILMDADAQGNVTSAMGMDKQPHFYQLLTLSDDDLRKQRVMRLVPPVNYTPANLTGGGELYLVSSDIRTSRLSPMMAKRNPNDPNEKPVLSKLILRERLQALQTFADFCIIDTPPTPSDLHEAIAAATDYVIIPTQCEAFSGLEGLPDTKAHTENIARLAAASHITASQIAGIVPNMTELKKSAVHREVLEIIRGAYGALVWEDIPKTETIRQAHLRAQSIYALYPRNKITKLMWTFVKRIEALA